MTRDNFSQWATSRGIHQVECIFPDITGFPRGKMMRDTDVAAGKELRIAQAIILQTVTGDYPEDRIIGETDSDARMLPDFSSLRQLPWAPERAWLIHDCVDLNGVPKAYAPRHVLRRILERYAEQGWQAVVAPEIEFYLFAQDGKAREQFSLPPLRGGRLEIKQSAYAVGIAEEFSAFWAELNRCLAALGIATDTWLHEMGPSQYEINLLHGDPLGKADEVMLFKTTLREVAARHGLFAVFMAKPLSHLDGSSMHLHQSLVDTNGMNLFSTAEGLPSPLFYHFIGGSQQLIPEFMPLFAPHINSWRRYHAGEMAPINLEWGEDNRTVALRIPRSGAQARRIENRIAGSDANPYLAIAASLACGLHGMLQQIEPRAPIHQQSAYGRSREIARSLDIALERFESSQTTRDLLGDIFVDAYCNVKAAELDHFMCEVGAWERHYLSALV